MRGQKEYPVERVPGTRRILILGDSFAFGYGVNDADVVSAVLEDLLNQRVPGSTEVINLAVSGFGQAEELVTWNAKARAYRPDIVVLFYFDNDIGNKAVSELYSLAPGGTLVATGKSYLPGSNLQERLFAFPPTRWLFEHSQAWNLVRNRLSSADRTYKRPYVGSGTGRGELPSGS
jgi:lysophospholipase L1-like esterase